MADKDKQLAKPFDSGALADQLRDKIRVDMAELMPPEVWRNLLKSEIEAFFEPRKITDYHGRPTGKTEPSVFRTVVESVIKDEAKKHLVDMLQQPEWAGFWEGHRHLAGIKIRDLIREAAPDIVAALLGDAIQRAVDQMQYTLRQT